MTRPHGQASAGVDRISPTRHRARARSLGAARRGPWLFSLLVATGAILTVTINGSGGATTQVPSVVQVGRQTAISPAPVATTIPTATSSSTTTTATSPSTTTTIPAVKRLTTVVRPQATVTDHEDPSWGDNSSETTVATTPTSSP